MRVEAARSLLLQTWTEASNAFTVFCVVLVENVCRVQSKETAVLGVLLLQHTTACGHALKTFSVLALALLLPWFLSAVGLDSCIPHCMRFITGVLHSFPPGSLSLFLFVFPPDVSAHDFVHPHSRSLLISLIRRHL